MSTERVDTTPTITLMAELLPQCIAVWEKRRRPLARGIREQIAAKVGDAIKPNELAAALGVYTHSTGYLLAMARPGAQRVDIEGRLVEPVAPAHAAGAAKILAGRWERKQARKAQAATARNDLPAPMTEKPRRGALKRPRNLACLW